VSLNLEVLHVPDCPNLDAMLDGLRQVTDLPITTREITTHTAAIMLGMAGSPTLLINGDDPFTTTGRPGGGLACRVYRDEHGNPTPAPSAAQLRAVLGSAQTTQVTMAEPGIHLMRVFGVSPATAMRYLRAAHLERGAAPPR
jgi:hypothetical protein